jgi:hypothetical protein
VALPRPCAETFRLQAEGSVVQRKEQCDIMSSLNGQLPSARVPAHHKERFE